MRAFLSRALVPALVTIATFTGSMAVMQPFMAQAAPPSSPLPAVTTALTIMRPDAPEHVIRLHELNVDYKVRHAGWVRYQARLAAQRAAQAPPVVTVAATTDIAAVPPPQGGYGTPSASFTSCVVAQESGGDVTAYNASSGASGLFGMLLSTWLSAGVGYPGGAYTAPASVQYQAFDIIYARDGTSPWGPYDGC